MQLACDPQVECKMFVRATSGWCEQGSRKCGPYQIAYLHHLSVACVSCAHVFIRGVLHRALHGQSPHPTKLPLPFS